MKLIVRCKVLRQGQPMLPPFALTYSDACESGNDLQDSSEENRPAPGPHGMACMWFWPTLQFGPSQIARYPDAIDALLEVKAFELRYNSLDRAVERLRQLVREGR